jgi:hypothetical protein
VGGSRGGVLQGARRGRAGGEGAESAGGRCWRVKGGAAAPWTSLQCLVCGWVRGPCSHLDQKQASCTRPEHPTHAQRHPALGQRLLPLLSPAHLASSTARKRGARVLHTAACATTCSGSVAAAVGAAPPLAASRRPPGAAGRTVAAKAMLASEVYAQCGQRENHRRRPRYKPPALSSRVIRSEARGPSAPRLRGLAPPPHPSPQQHSRPPPAQGHGLRPGPVLPPTLLGSASCAAISGTTPLPFCHACCPNAATCSQPASLSPHPAQPSSAVNGP